MERAALLAPHREVGRKVVKAAGHTTIPRTRATGLRATSSGAHGRSYTPMMTLYRAARLS